MRYAPLAVCIFLAACNAPRQTQPMVDPVNETPDPVEAPGCAGAISRYRSVVDNDLSMGHVDRSVHNTIQGELREASSACSGGQEARAMSLLRASKLRHGYPGG